MSQRILVVEDSPVLARLIKKKLEEGLSMMVDSVESLAEAKALLSRCKPSEYLMAILDLNLPDAPNGEAVDYVSSLDIPSVVLTGTFDENVRNDLFSRNIIDYLIKEGGRDLDLIVTTVRRLRRNAESKILVVDDSRFSRQYLAKLLQRQHYQVLEAKDGIEALAIFEKETSVRLVITDYNMPNMDGGELIQALRKKLGPESLAIIGISASDENYLTARLLKQGANDFLKKPFSVEEFYCRVNQNLELINLVEEIKQASNTDYLTKLYNRRYFFEIAPRNYERYVRSKKAIAVAMMDIDFFKKINDSYGHDAGDLALLAVANLLKNSFRPTDVLARFGGEEFCVMLLDATVEIAISKLEAIRKEISEMVIEFEDKTFSMTISIGVATDYGTNLGSMLKIADERLYLAKTGGRNQVVFSG